MLPLFPLSSFVILSLISKIISKKCVLGICPTPHHDIPIANSHTHHREVAHLVRQEPGTMKKKANSVQTAADDVFMTQQTIKVVLRAMAL